jgi:hypothetical protein
MKPEYNAQQIRNLRLASSLLILASEKFSDHGSNDLNISRFLPTKEERIDFDREYHIWNGDPEEHDPEFAGNNRIVNDSIVMYFIASEILDLAYLLEKKDLVLSDKES